MLKPKFILLILLLFLSSVFLITAVPTEAEAKISNKTVNVIAFYEAPSIYSTPMN